MQKVLIISYFFEPCKFVGSERTEYWAKNLYHYGFYPIILNVRGYGASTKLENKKYVDWLKKLAKQNNVFPIYVCNHLKRND